MTKTCTKCKEVRDLSCYRSRGGSQKHLLNSWCNNCRKKDHKSWVKNNPDKVRQYRAKDPWTLKKRCNRHNISVENFWSLYEDQDGTCPICEDPIKAEDSAIDHNHSTGEVRGILCKTCNRALGLLKDDPKVLGRAKKYLKTKGYYGNG